jgi:hypothetical protein
MGSAKYLTDESLKSGREDDKILERMTTEYWTGGQITTGKVGLRYTGEDKIRMVDKRGEVSKQEISRILD